MCKYCEGNEYLIGNGWDGLTISDATLIMYSYENKHYKSIVRKKPINYCPMCGMDLVDDIVNKLRSERQYE